MMKLTQLMEGCGITPADVEVKGITRDSRRVEPGWVFVCISGTAVDGHQFAEQAKKAVLRRLSAKGISDWTTSCWCRPPA